MISRSRWINILKTLGTQMKSKPTFYRWKSPVNETVTMQNSTCVGYVNLALQRAGLLPAGKYVHYSNGKLAGTGLSYIRTHKELYEIKHVSATPQKLGNNLQVGDICLYSVPHIQVYAGKNSSGTPLWYSLERSAKGIGYPAKLTLAGTFGFYSKRKIEYIIRLKFTDGAPAPTPDRYKLKTAMNLRANANANSSTKVLARIPQGAILTVIKSNGTWKNVNYCGITGWVNCASQYATKL